LADGHERRKGVGVVLGLREKIRGYLRGISGIVGHHH
jgi:hypothetical protein